MNPARRLTPAQENSLAIAAAVVTANAYYIHPIIALVADHFGVSHARIGLVPALNQLALAVGIFLLLPLGDRYSNRRLTILFASGQTGSLALMKTSRADTRARARVRSRLGPPPAGSSSRARPSCCQRAW